MALFKNDIITLEIESMTSDGKGVGRTNENIVVFVPDTAVGDEITAKILKVKKNVAFAKVEEIITPSADRIISDCPVSTKCGGCIYRHISYDAELKVKYDKVKDAIGRIAKQDVSKIRDIVPADSVDFYRNKAQIPVGLDKAGNVVMGFYSRHSHHIVPCLDCKLSPKIFSDITNTVYEFLCKNKSLVYNEETGKGYIRHLYLRYAKAYDTVMVCFVVNGKDFPHSDIIVNSLIEKYPQIKSIVVNVNREKTNVILGKKNITLYGDDYITDKLCDLDFKISPLSFYQVNRDMAEKLYKVAKDYANLSKDDVLFDLYCGTGTIGLSMAKDCKKLYGVEIIEQAVENAKENARANNIKNAEFFCADASSSAEKLKKDGIIPDVVVVDPPRKGLTEELIKTISQMSPKRVVYVSCDPATLARDLALFAENNYSTEELTPVDMFPRTHHVETVALITKN